MIGARIAAVANPYTAIVGTFLLLAMLLTTISLTTFERQWVIFLGGVLAAAILAYTSRATNARWIITRRTAQLNQARGRLATETRLRTHAEEALARVRNNVELIDESLPAMLAYVDGEERVRYHNHAYTRWVGIEDKSIDGKRVEDLMGRATYAEIQGHLKDALGGRDVRYERTQTMATGQTCRLSVQYLPHHAKDGKVAGVFTILTDITRAADLVSAQPHTPEEVPEDDGARLISALENDEFCLYSQDIVALGSGAPEGAFCEVLLRLNEEEENLLPPGTFLPLAEELGLLHEIDRWVVRHVVDFAAAASTQGDAVFFVNLSAPTVLDPGYAQFVRAHLETRGVSGEALCFELTEAGVLSDPEAYREFIAAFDGSGCRFAVSGFGRNPLSLAIVKQLQVHFLKLDGGIVLDMLRSPAGLAKVKAINQVAHAAGMRTIAQCVESDSTREALELIETDFAQGFGIASPRPINELRDHILGESSPNLQKAAA